MVMHIHRTMPIAVIACAVLEREVELYARGAEHIRDVRIVEMGLHERPARLREQLQAHLDEFGARADIEAIALVYGLCGLGTAGLQARKPFVIPRAHDCITIFMGGKELFAEQRKRSPGAYYYSPGWNRARRVPGPERLEALRAAYAETLGPDAVADLLEAEREQWAACDTAAFIDLGTDDAAAACAAARRCARWLGWKFERLAGDPGLLRDLLWCAWDRGRFQVVRPGMCLAHVADGGIMTEKMPDAQ